MSLARRYLVPAAPAAGLVLYALLAMPRPALPQAQYVPPDVTKGSYANPSWITGLAGSKVPATVASGTPGRIPFESTAGLLVDSANMTYAESGADGKILLGAGHPAGIQSEASGIIASVGINVDQFGGRDTTQDGGIFRLDTRGVAGGNYPWFQLIHQPAGSTSYLTQTVPLCITTYDTVALGALGNIAPNTPLGTLDVYTAGASSKGVVVRLQPSPTGNALEVQDSSGNPLLAHGSAGGGAQVIFIANATTAPTASPSGGGILYVSGGALLYKGSSGTVTTLANP